MGGRGSCFGAAVLPPGDDALQHIRLLHSCTSSCPSFQRRGMGYLGPSGALTGPSWSTLGTSGGAIGPSWGSLGPSLGRFWAMQSLNSPFGLLEGNDDDDHDHDDDDDDYYYYYSRDDNNKYYYYYDYYYYYY